MAGPGRLMSTPDPTGAYFRHEVPDSLPLIRVRRSFWMDPHRAGHGSRFLVLECEDDGAPVLVVTRRKDMPCVLGALQAPLAPDHGLGSVHRST
jgi:hypothetical protein